MMTPDPDDDWMRDINIDQDPATAGQTPPSRLSVQLRDALNRVRKRLFGRTGRGNVPTEPSIDPRLLDQIEQEIELPTVETSVPLDEEDTAILDLDAIRETHPELADDITALERGMRQSVVQETYYPGESKTSAFLEALERADMDEELARDAARIAGMDPEFKAVFSETNFTDQMISDMQEILGIEMRRLPAADALEEKMEETPGGEPLEEKWDEPWEGESANLGEEIAEESVAESAATNGIITPAIMNGVRIGYTTLFSMYAAINLGIKLHEGEKLDTLEVINQMNMIYGGPAALLAEASIGAGAGAIGFFISMGIVGVYAALRMGEADKKINDARNNFRQASNGLYGNITDKVLPNVSRIARAKRTVNAALESANRYTDLYYKYLMPEKTRRRRLTSYNYTSDLSTQRVVYDTYTRQAHSRYLKKNHFDHHLLPIQKVRGYHGEMVYDFKDVDYAPYKEQVNKMTGFIARELNKNAYIAMTTFEGADRERKAISDRYNQAYKSTKALLEYQLNGGGMGLDKGVRIRNLHQEMKLIQLYNVLKENSEQDEHMKNLFDGYDPHHIDQTIDYNTRLALMTNDDLMLRHFKAQSLVDKGYQEAFNSYVAGLNTQFNQYLDGYIQKKVDAATTPSRKATVRRNLESIYRNNPRYVMTAEMARRGMSMRDGYRAGQAMVNRMKRIGFHPPDVPFWVKYYEKNQVRFRQEDLLRIGNKKHAPRKPKQPKKPDAPAAPTTPTTPEKPKPPPVPDKPEVPFTPVKPHPPPPPPIPDVKRRRRIRPFHLKENTGKYRDTGLDDDWSNAPRENGDTGIIYRFTPQLALHLLQVCEMTYEATQSYIPPSPHYDAVEFLGSEGWFQSAQGLGLYNSQDDTVVIALRGTEFSTITNNFTGLFSPINKILDMARIAMRNQDDYNKVKDLLLKNANIDHADRGIADILTDLNFSKISYEGGINVHSGFAAYIESIFADVLKFIRNHDTGNTTFIFTGHSLGGVADLLKFKLKLSMLKTRNTLSYTFGSPRFTDEAGVEIFNDLCPNTFRITNDHDMIPHLPPTILSYKHVGKEWDLTHEAVGSFDVYDYGDDSRRAYTMEQFLWMLNGVFGALLLGSVVENLQGSTINAYMRGFVNSLYYFEADTVAAVYQDLLGILQNNEFVADLRTAVSTRQRIISDFFRTNNISATEDLFAGRGAGFGETLEMNPPDSDIFSSDTFSIRASRRTRRPTYLRYRGEAKSVPSIENTLSGDIITKPSLLNAERLKYPRLYLNGQEEYTKRDFLRIFRPILEERRGMKSTRSIDQSIGDFYDALANSNSRFRNNPVYQMLKRQRNTELTPTEVRNIFREAQGVLNKNEVASTMQETLGKTRVKNPRLRNRVDAANIIGEQSGLQQQAAQAAKDRLSAAGGINAFSTTISKSNRISTLFNYLFPNGGSDVFNFFASTGVAAFAGFLSNYMRKLPFIGVGDDLLGIAGHRIEEYERLLRGLVSQSVDLGISYQNPYSKLENIPNIKDEEERIYARQTSGIFTDDENVVHTPQFYAGNVYMQSVPQEYILGFYLYDSSIETQGQVQGLVVF